MPKPDPKEDLKKLRAALADGLAELPPDASLEAEWRWRLRHVFDIVYADRQGHKAESIVKLLVTHDPSLNVPVEILKKLLDDKKDAVKLARVAKKAAGALEKP